MPIYIYKDNSQISTNAIRNTRVVKTVYAKEQGKEAVCVWGVGIDLSLFTYTKHSTWVEITGLRGGVSRAYLIIPEKVENLLVTQINDSVFSGRNELTSVTIPNSVTYIGDSAFKDCSSLTTVNWNATTCPSAGSHYKPIFEGCPNLAIVNIGDNVKIIPSGVFFGCTGLTRVTIGNSVTSIDSWAFDGCTGLTSITIPDSVTSIGFYAFNGCTGLTSVTIPDSGTSIGDYAFYNCSGLTNIIIPDSVTSIGKDAFDNTLWYNNQPNGLVYAGKVAYKYKGTMPSNTSIVLKEETLGIAGSAFYNCSGLTSITIPNSVKNIGDYAFQSCTELRNITIPDGVTSIDDYAFDGCTRLSSIIIPDSVTSIGYEAFRNTAWYSNRPNGLVYAGKVAYKYKGTMGTSTSITLKEGTLGITDYAFNDCANLEKITIPNSVKNIGDYAFYDCGKLISVTIPDSVTSIGRGAFDGCYRLDNIVIGNSVTSIIGSTFSECRALKSITIGNSVTSIGSYAFSNCTALTKIIFEGTKAQWNAIFKDYKWDYNTGSYTIYCTDGSIPKQ